MLGKMGARDLSVVATYNIAPLIQPWLKRGKSAPRTCAKYSERAVGPKNLASPAVPKYIVPVNLVGECSYEHDA